MKAAVEQVFNGTYTQVAIGGSYDATKINRGKHTGQFNLGSGDTDKFIGPAPLGVANFGESSLAIPSQFVHPVQITNDLFWVFGSDVATAAATRRVQLWTFVPSTNTYTLQGAITLIAGLLLALITLFAGYDHVDFFWGPTLQLNQQGLL